MKLHIYLLKFLFLLRLGYQTRCKYIRIFIIHLDLFKFIHLLYCWGLVLSYRWCKFTRYFILELAYVRQQPVLLNMRFFLYHGAFPYISLKLLLRLYLCEDTMFFILYTTRGVLIDKDAITAGLGGFLLCSFI